MTQRCQSTLNVDQKHFREEMPGCWNVEDFTGIRGPVCILGVYAMILWDRLTHIAEVNLEDYQLTVKK